MEGVAPFSDLVGRDVRADAPDRVWAADMKQIRTGEGWLYLAAVQDLFSRRIVGRAIAEHMRAELVVDALTMALAARRPPNRTKIDTPLWVLLSPQGAVRRRLREEECCH